MSEDADLIPELSDSVQELVLQVIMPSPVSPVSSLLVTSGATLQIVSAKSNSSASSSESDSSNPSISSAIGGIMLAIGSDVADVVLDAHGKDEESTQTIPPADVESCSGDAMQMPGKCDVESTGLVSGKSQLQERETLRVASTNCGSRPGLKSMESS